MAIFNSYVKLPEGIYDIDDDYCEGLSKHMYIYMIIYKYPLVI